MQNLFMESHGYIERGTHGRRLLCRTSQGTGKPPENYRISEQQDGLPQE